ncbi:MAG: DUF692 domain-containing protein [Deltaproteobacteria bacterium]|nr:DUF692 domain-containing protein [Deltaproteobacteria bacterium]
MQRTECLQGPGRLQSELDLGGHVNNRWGLKNLGVGLGLRTAHYGTILADDPPVDWFEIISENYMQTEGRPLYMLDQIAERYPIVMHGVSMSIGSTDPLDEAYLRALRALKKRVRAAWLSDHLCWTGVAGKHVHDLLPLPYTEEALRHVTERVRYVQDFLDAPILLENPSTYIEFQGSTMPEYEFLSRLAEDADCGILLDLNNIYVSCFNHGYDPHAYLDAIPMDRVVQFHVAGHTNCGTHLIDTHIGPVIDPVWTLFREAYERTGGRSMLLEWDAEIPSFEETHKEALKAHRFATFPKRPRRSPNTPAGPADTADTADTADAADAQASTSTPPSKDAP